MSELDPYEIARSITALNAWEKMSRHNWALVPQTSESPIIASVVSEKGDGPVVGRLLLFEGFEEFSRLLLHRQMPDFGVAMGPVDFRHYEAVGLRDGSVELFVYEPGFVPMPPDAGQRRFLASILKECLGVMIRFEEDERLAVKYAAQNAMFARKELCEGSWIDGPLKIRQDKMQMVERITVSREGAQKASAFPIMPKEIWELDFVMLPSYHTVGPKPRFLYLLVAVDAETGERRIWDKMSVDGNAGGLQRLWEGHADRLLKAILALGRVPGSIHLRSRRMMRFLRPLGMHLPFKLVQHSKLPALESVLELAVRTRKV